MTRTHIVTLMILAAAVPAATAGSFFISSAGTWSAKPCFFAGNAGYELTASASANYTVRIDNMAVSPSLRMQVVDDPAAADFVLVDDGDAADACKAVTAVKSVRIDPAATNADLTIAVSAQPADYKIYVRSANFTEQDAAALFAVIWQNARKAGLGREFAERH